MANSVIRCQILNTHSLLVMGCCYLDLFELFLLLLSFRRRTGLTTTSCTSLFPTTCFSIRTLPLLLHTTTAAADNDDVLELVRVMGSLLRILPLMASMPWPYTIWSYLLCDTKKSLAFSQSSPCEVDCFDVGFHSLNRVSWFNREYDTVRVRSYIWMLKWMCTHINWWCFLHFLLMQEIKNKKAR